MSKLKLRNFTSWGDSASMKSGRLLISKPTECGEPLKNNDIFDLADA